MQDKVKIVKIITISAVIFVILLAVSLVINLIKIAGLNNRKAELKNKLASLERQIGENDDTIAYMSTDSYVDRYAREYLDLIGGDEQPFSAK